MRQAQQQPLEVFGHDMRATVEHIVAEQPEQRGRYADRRVDQCRADASAYRGRIRYATRCARVEGFRPHEEIGRRKASITQLSLLDADFGIFSGFSVRKAA